MNAALTLRLANTADIPALEELIPLSARTLQSSHYSPEQVEAALGPVFGVDRQLISDGTYFVVEAEAQIVGCGGWSRRKTLFGGDSGRAVGEEARLDPSTDPARIRAFFVHPAWARQGIGRRLLEACERAAGEAGFRAVELVATLAGEPLYAAFAYRVIERDELPLPNGLTLPAVRMAKRLG